MYCPFFLVQHQRQQKANKSIILVSVKRSFKGKTFPSLLALLVHQRQDGRLLSIQSQHTDRGERVNLLTVTTDTADYSEFLLMHLSSLCPLVTCNFRKCLISSSVPFVRIHFLYVTFHAAPQYLFQKPTQNDTDASCDSDYENYDFNDQPSVAMATALGQFIFIVLDE
jgi:hypothetical protein